MNWRYCLIILEDISEDALRFLYSSSELRRNRSSCLGSGLRSLVYPFINTGSNGLIVEFIDALYVRQEPITERLVTKVPIFVV